MNIDTSKTLGGIGALLLFIGLIPFVQYLWVVGIIGVVLILAALHGLAGEYNASGIFSNAIYGIIIGVVGVVISVGVAIAAVFANLSNINDFIIELYPGWNGDWSTLPNLTPSTANLNPLDILPIITNVIIVIVAVLVILWIFAIIATFFFRRSLKQTTEKSNTGLFGTAGTLLFVGAILIIVFGFGLLLMWIAILLLAIAFFTLKTQTQPMSSSPPPPP
jgi:uncharacterized membrane protein